MKQFMGAAIVMVILIAIIAGGVWMAGSTERSYASKSTREIALLCTTDMATQFHIHPVLTIYIDGEKQVIPANTGITATCMHSLHTHDETGTLHVEAPIKRDFTLGDFFAVWGKTFTRDQILDSKADASHTINLTVNGTPVDTFENTVLVDKDQLVISYSKK